MLPQKKSYSPEEFAKSAENGPYGTVDKISTHSSSDADGKTKPSVKHNPFLGLFYSLNTSVYTTLTAVFVKKLPYISPAQLSFVRNVAVFAGSLPIAIYCVKEIIGPRKDRLKLVIRGFLAATNSYLNMVASRYLPLAEAAIVMATFPAVTTVMARIYLKETCGWVQSFVVIITLCGVLLSFRLPELLNKTSEISIDYTYIGGLASAVGCVICSSATSVTLRKMKDLHFSVPLLYLGVFGMIENGVINAVTSRFVCPQCGLDQMLVMLIGILSLMSNCTFTLAIQVEAVAIIAVLKASLDIIVAFLFQVIFFDGNLDMYNISGACIVIFSISIMGFRNWLFTLPEESKTRKRFRYVLL